MNSPRVYQQKTQGPLLQNHESDLGLQAWIELAFREQLVQSTYTTVPPSLKRILDGTPLNLPALISRLQALESFMNIYPQDPRFVPDVDNILYRLNAIWSVEIEDHVNGLKFRCKRVQDNGQELTEEHWEMLIRYANAITVTGVEGPNSDKATILRQIGWALGRASFQLEVNLPKNIEVFATNDQAVAGRLMIQWAKLLVSFYQRGISPSTSPSSSSVSCFTPSRTSQSRRSDYTRSPSLVFSPRSTLRYFQKPSLHASAIPPGPPLDQVGSNANHHLVPPSRLPQAGFQYGPVPNANLPPLPVVPQGPNESTGPKMGLPLRPPPVTQAGFQFGPVPNANQPRPPLVG